MIQRIFHAACAVIVLFRIVHGGHVISGVQEGYFERDEYLVTGNVRIPRGSRLIFAPGSIIRFRPYCGMFVEGTLKCVGEKEIPITFTSANDRPDSPVPPAPFDWNGIRVVAPDAEVVLSHVKIAYSVFGIEVKPASVQQLRLENLVPFMNGRATLTLGGEKEPVADNEPFSYIFPQPEQNVTDHPPPEEDDIIPGTSRGSASTGTPRKTGNIAPEQWVRIALAAMAIGGVSAGAYSDMLARKNDLRYRSAPRYDADADNKRREYTVYEIIGFSIAGLSAGGLYLTFRF